MESGNEWLPNRTEDAINLCSDVSNLEDELDYVSQVDTMLDSNESLSNMVAKFTCHLHFTYMWDGAPLL